MHIIKQYINCNAGTTVFLQQNRNAENIDIQKKCKPKTAMQKKLNAPAPSQTSQTSSQTSQTNQTRCNKTAMPGAAGQTTFMNSVVTYIYRCGLLLRISQ